jgi:ABC-type transport system substrate-binding protein
MQMAIDLPQIAESYYGGVVEWSPSGLINPSFTGWTTPYAEWPSELKAEYGYDPEGAATLLAEAGYADGFETSCSAGSFSDLDLLQIVKAQLAEVGIEMEIEVVGDSALYYNFIQNGGHEGMCITSQLSSPDKPFNSIKNRTTGNIVNFTYCDDPAYDALVEAVSNASSLEDVMAGCVEADMYTIEQHWTVRLLTTVTPVVWQPYIKGYTGELLFTSGQMTEYTARWWVDQDLKASME